MLSGMTGWGGEFAVRCSLLRVASVLTAVLAMVGLGAGGASNSRSSGQLRPLALTASCSAASAYPSPGTAAASSQSQASFRGTTSARLLRLSARARYSGP